VAAASAAAAVADGLDGDEKKRVADALVNPERVDDAVAGHLEAVLWRCARLDDSLGPQAALDTVLAQRALVQTLLARAGRPVRDRLLSLYADLCGFAGWLSFDLGDHPAAVASYETARAAAHDTGHDALAALILCNMSQTATWHGQPRVGIDHATAAQRWADRAADAPLRAYARDVAARAYAGDQQPAAAYRAIDHARELLAGASKDAPTLVYFYTPGQLTSTESACHLQLGDPQRAGRTAEAALTAIGSKFVRNRALVTLRLASCRLRGPSPDVAGAAEALGEAARLAGRHRSIRVARQLHRGWRELQPWHHTTDVRPLRAQLTALGLLSDGPPEWEVAGPDGLRSSKRVTQVDVEQRRRRGRPTHQLPDLAPTPPLVDRLRLHRLRLDRQRRPLLRPATQQRVMQRPTHPTPPIRLTHREVEQHERPPRPLHRHLRRQRLDQPGPPARIRASGVPVCELHQLAPVKRQRHRERSIRQQTLQPPPVKFRLVHTPEERRRREDLPVDRTDLIKARPRQINPVQLHPDTAGHETSLSAESAQPCPADGRNQHGAAHNGRPQRCHCGHLTSRLSDRPLSPTIELRIITREPPGRVAPGSGLRCARARVDRRAGSGPPPPRFWLLRGCSDVSQGVRA
jgi:hypothetical protein